LTRSPCAARCSSGCRDPTRSRSRQPRRSSSSSCLTSQTNPADRRSPRWWRDLDFGPCLTGSGGSSYCRIVPREWLGSVKDSGKRGAMQNLSHFPPLEGRGTCLTHLPCEAPKVASKSCLSLDRVSRRVYLFGTRWAHPRLLGTDAVPFLDGGRAGARTIPN